VTVVIPNAKFDPDGGEHELVTPGRLSVTVGGGYVTASDVWFEAAWALTSCGQRIVGACASRTVIMKLQVAVRPPARSVAVQFTVEVPSGNVEPDGGTQT
jgi:hypothetical protein